MYVQMYVHTYVHMYMYNVCMYVCTCMYVCIYKCNVHMYRWYMYMYKQLYVHVLILHTLDPFSDFLRNFFFLRPNYSTKINHNMIINLWTYYELPHQTHHQNLLSRYIPHCHGHSILLPCLFELLLC